MTPEGHRKTPWGVTGIPTSEGLLGSFWMKVATPEQPLLPFTATKPFLWKKDGDAGAYWL